MGKWRKRGVGPRKGKRRERKKHTNGQTEPDGVMGTSEKDWGQGAAAEGDRKSVV